MQTSSNSNSFLNILVSLNNGELARLFCAAVLFVVFRVEIALTGKESLLWPDIRACLEAVPLSIPSPCPPQTAPAAAEDAPAPQKESRRQRARRLEAEKNRQAAAGTRNAKPARAGRKTKKQSSPILFWFPLEDGSTYPVDEASVKKWSNLYPLVDICDQLRFMLGWFDAHPKGLKTKDAIRPFITSWLRNEQSKLRRELPAEEQKKKTSNPFRKDRDTDRNEDGDEDKGKNRDD